MRLRKSIITALGRVRQEVIANYRSNLRSARTAEDPVSKLTN